jgi:hypothetical protein
MLLKGQSQCQLHLPRSICVSRSRKAGGHLIVGGEVLRFNGLRRLDELACVADQAVRRYLDPLIVTIQEVERFSYELKLPSVFRVNPTGEAKICGGVIRSHK